MASPPRGQYSNVAIDSLGNAVTTTKVTVYQAVPYAASPQTTLASIFSAETGAGTPGNPFFATTGEISFWAAPGSYDIKIEDNAVPPKFATKIVRWDVVPGDKGLIAAQIADSAVTSTAVADGTIVNADVAAGAAIAESKLSLASDAAAGTASRRSLGTSSTQAAAGDDSRLTNQRAPLGPETGLKIIRGVVSSVGGIVAGSGFSVTQTSTGRYTVTFSSAFSARPSVTVTTEGQVGKTGVTPVVGSVAVLIGDASNTATDIQFSFIAIGPA